MKKLDFNTPPKKFPEVWMAGEEVTFDINAIINKHVYLALEEYTSDVHAMEWTSPDGHAGLWVSFGDFFEAEIDLEKTYFALEDNWTTKAHFLQLAASFRKLANHMEKLAETAR